MRIRMTRQWHSRAFPSAHLDAGREFDVTSSVASYLMAMHCAEPSPARAPRRRRPRGLPTAAPLLRFIRDGAIAEARLKVAGRWHRLRVELDEALMSQCSFYRERGGGLGCVRC